MDQELINKRWTIVKLLKRITNYRNSIYDRQYLFNTYYLINKIYTLYKQKQSQNIEFDGNALKFLKSKIESDLFIELDEKKILTTLIDNFNSKSLNKPQIEKIDKIIKNLSPNRKNIKLSYSFRVENLVKNTINKFITNKKDCKIEYLKDILSIYISTRIDLGFSLQMMKYFLDSEEKKLKKNNIKNFMGTIFDKFQTRSIYKKELYSIYIPLIVQKNLWSKLNDYILYSSPKTELKFVRYSNAENEMTSNRYDLIKNFNKDCLYLYIGNKTSVDYNTLSNKLRWLKAENVLSIFRMHGIKINVDNQYPIIVLKHLKNRKKINAFWINSYTSTSIKQDTLLPISSSKKYIQIINAGILKEKSSKFNSFLGAKADYENSINPIQKIYLSAKMLELFLKYPFKKSYGRNTTMYESIMEMVNNATEELLKSHKLYLILFNRKLLKWELKRDIDQNIINKKPRHITKLIKDIDNITFFNQMEEFNKHQIKEIQNPYKDQHDDFRNFLYLSSIFICQERNNQVHNKSNYNLKDILLAGVVYGLTSAKARNDLLLLNKKNKHK